VQLPESLQPWRLWLDWFDPELIPAVGGLLSRVHPLLGPIREQDTAGQSEFEGLGDLRRRGNYEHLLATEWLLADELPDEFLRRVASGEHLFLAPARQAHRANRLTIALFDAGPRQLGAPRLAHLAMLILLARRAVQAGGELRWGLLQTPGKLLPLESSAQLKKLLSGRCYQSPSAADIDEWQAAIARLPSPPGECWLIGPPGLREQTRTLPAPRHAMLRRTPENAVLELDLGNGKLRLPLPDEKAAVRLLKGQFKSEAGAQLNQASSQRLSLLAAPLLSPDGARIAAPLLDERGVLLIQLPSLSRPDTKVKSSLVRWSVQRPPLTLAFAGRQLCGIVSAEEKLNFWQLPDFESVDLPPRETLLIPPGTVARLPCAWITSSAGNRLFLLDKAGRLAYWTARRSQMAKQRDTQPATTKILDLEVLGMSAVNGDTGLTYIRRDGQLLQWVTVDGALQDQHTLALGPAPEKNPAVFFASLRQSNRGLLRQACAVQEKANKQDAWRVHPGVDAPAETWRIPANWSVVGLHLSPENHQAGLVVLNTPRLSVGLLHRDGLETLYTAPRPIVRLSVGTQAGVIAMLTDDRQLIVHSITPPRLLLHLHSASESAAKAQA